MRTPINTYRLQFHHGFGFADASSLVPYLAALGVTDCYSSPQLKPSSGSTHGYDICDHRRLNDALGSRAEYDAFTASLAAHGMGQILDIVPNHMGADPAANLWWRDVLENGPSSPYAEFFDIDWDPVKPELKGKVLLPMLGDQYGRVLERGQLQLQFGRGELSLQYFDRNLPINPRQAPRILALDLDRLQQGREQDTAVREYLSILTALQNLPAYTERDPVRIVERQREKEVTRERLDRLIVDSPHILEHVQRCVRRANGTPGDRTSFDELHELLERQPYRLAYWRTAFDEINYRRFFDVNELVALRVERPDVFEATHELVKSLLESGQVTGLRVDHPDGLFDPQTYLERLQGLGGGRPVYIVAEKILSQDESLPAGWPVAGTTGYSFLNLVSGLFVDARAAKPLLRMYRRFTGRTGQFEDLAYECKRIILLTSLASELNVLAHALNRISESDRRCRDFTLQSCRRVLLEVIACLRYYRTYVNERGISTFDNVAITGAIDEAARRNPLMEASIFNFLRGILLPDANDENVRERLYFSMKFQQLTGPIQAKGVEDTAFYRYNVLVSANDVGGHPQRLGVSIDQFHKANVSRRSDHPFELIATATHDAKRGEDTRARIQAVSEIPADWRRAVSEWARMNAANRTKIAALWAPDRNDEYLFYQTLAGVWPAEPADAPVPMSASEELIERVSQYMQKAVREAKVHTSWIDENQAYGNAVTRFVERTLRGRTAPRFLAAFLPVQRRLARIGMVNSLSQLVLKMASPGVSDFYQGSELWNLDLVDPDNRRPVDYELRTTLLDGLEPLLRRVEAGHASDGEVAGMVAAWHDARIKLFVTASGLRFRRARPGLMLEGDYVPLETDGPARDRVVAFLRTHHADTLACAVPRLIDHESDWQLTRIALPATLNVGCFRHVFTGARVDVVRDGGRAWLPVAELCRSIPVALLTAA